MTVITACLSCAWVKLHGGLEICVAVWVVSGRDAQAQMDQGGKSVLRPEIGQAETEHSVYL